ncbi:phage portal protein [Allokutzneria sp. A3M-2-11 16]|uniref:phage portal protein n=1 Tax=Allokutzneria sp. A3M-2-11 16 TaxID=2962043 RepID=UPI0020B758D4|nr:phage portal protein [Allokutzneria sp. A3M-2-11 16]MCP3801845.1 phage portal protein [Allokutzneria sp. A3M-2-11 16]
MDIATRIHAANGGTRGRTARLLRYINGEHDTPRLPSGVSPELRRLAEDSRLNLLPLIVESHVQRLKVDGYRTKGAEANSSPWADWQANRMDARQSSVHRDAITYGVSYVVVLPGEPSPVIRPVSPRRMVAVYDDEASDDFPLYALEVRRSATPAGPRNLARLYDANAVYFLAAEEHGGGWSYVEHREHGLDVCPVVRFRNTYETNAEGYTLGEIERRIPMQNSLNQTNFSLAVIKEFGAFRQRYAIGWEPPRDEKTGLPREDAALTASIRRLWAFGDPDVKLGEFDATNMDGYLRAREDEVRFLAVLAQVPPQALLGQLANLSAEALTATGVGQDRLIEDRETLFGESWEDVLRLCARVRGDLIAASDNTSEVIWRDTTARSLAQIVDALGKMVQMLSVPAEAVWSRIPGVTQTEVESWQRMAREGDSLAQLAATLDRQADTATEPTPAAEVPASTA